jgi:hypothetical protein
MDKKFAALPASESVRLIDFEEAQVNAGIVNDTFFLTVSGMKPYANMVVELSPVIYVRRPEYWRIEVIGYIPGGIGLPAEMPYSVSIPLAGITGTKGIEVVGANKEEKFDVPPGGSTQTEPELCNERGDVKYRANQVPGAVVIIAEGTHGSPGYEVFFEQLPIDIFPPQFRLLHRRPSGLSIQLETPFVAVAHFNAPQPVESVTVHDAGGSRQVSVDQTHD